MSEIRTPGTKILVIKLGALGDVMRTTTLLPALRRRFPQSAVAWITKPAAVGLLDHAGLWKILPWNVDAVLWAKSVAWDVVISLDKEEGPTALAQEVQAPIKYGFGRNSHGLLQPLSESTWHLFRLGLDDEAKFRVNDKTYPHLIADVCEVGWGPNPYVLQLTDPERAWADSVAAGWGTGPFVGLNVGSGEAFAGKKWLPDRLLELARRLQAQKITPVFLGGAAEKAEYQDFRNQAGELGVFPGCEFDLRQFMALVSKLQVLVSGDTLAMHIAIATRVYSVAWFGSTTEREIEFYGRGEALVGRVPCGPCYKRVCPTREECLQKISVDQVLAAVLRGLARPAHG